jgi:SHS2 domain-containing protein
LNQDLYGCDLVVEFVARLRPEQRFNQVADLIAQIDRDSEKARRILGVPPERAAQASREAPRRGRDELLPVPGQSDTICPYRFREIEHTADRALWVWGQEPRDLFVAAAEGMYGLMADVDGLVATGWHEICLHDIDWESLLVRWLNELLFLTEQEGLLFVEYRILSITNTTLLAEVGAVPGPVTKAHIKAATFHALDIVQDEKGWSTEITFDV